MSLARNITIGLVAVAAIFVSGMLIGTILPRSNNQATDAEQSAKAETHDDHENVVILTRQQRQLLGLRLRRVIAAPYLKSVLIPGMIVEKPGRSNHIVSTTVNGIVTKVHAVPGQAVNPGDPLFDLRLTGEALATAQSELLAVLKELEVVEAEIKRLEPLAASGGVAGKQKLDFEYQLKQLLGRRDVRNQELLVRGLSESQIDSIITNESLVREFTVRVPMFSPDDLARLDSKGRAEGDQIYAIERLDVFPGKSVKPGDDLCHLAWHHELYVRGQAFESEIDNLNALQDTSWDVTLKFGADDRGTSVKGFDILYVDNHVDETSQTFRFYIPLKNDVMTERLDERGNLFRTWRYKPGQRVHVEIPVEAIDGQFPLPTQAVVNDGTNSYVFRKLDHDHSHDHAEGEAGHAHGDEMEFEAVLVRVLFQDSETVVVDATGLIKAGDSVAVNKAYQLYVALKSDSGGGHDHHGHAH